MEDTYLCCAAGLNYMINTEITTDEIYELVRVDKMKGRTSGAAGVGFGRPWTVLFVEGQPNNQH
jgi:hypothetical protein